MSELTDALEQLQQLDGVADAVDRARAACTELRWHAALRRRTPEAAAESRVRGACANATLEGVNFPVDLVRDRMRGAVPPHGGSDPAEQVLTAAIRLAALGESLPQVIVHAPRQAVARAHTVAMAGLLPQQALGRPRTDAQPAVELDMLPPAPSGEEAAARLDQVLALIETDESHAILVAALAHAELAVARPFDRGNALVGRAVERAILIGRGVDPTGVAVPELGYAARRGEYATALRDYATGGVDGVRRWLIWSASAVAAGAFEGAKIGDAVISGLITNS